MLRTRDCMISFRNQYDGGVPGNLPVVFAFQGRCAGSPVAWILAGPNQFPSASIRRRQQRFGRRIQAEVDSEIREHKALQRWIAECVRWVLAAKKAKRKSFPGQHRPFDAPSAGM